MGHHLVDGFIEMGDPLKCSSAYHGESQSKMDDEDITGSPMTQETSIWIYRGFTTQKCSTIYKWDIQYLCGFIGDLFIGSWK